MATGSASFATSRKDFLDGPGRDLGQSAHPEPNGEPEFPMHENGKKMAKC
jgi:hypothetical protein